MSIFRILVLLLAIGPIAPHELAGTADAQVRGRCVRHCNPPPNRHRESTPAQLDSKLILTGVSVEIRGDVTLVYPNGERVKATARTPVAFGTRVITGPGSRAVFMLLDETTFTMHGDSEMVVDEFVYDPGTSVKKMSIRVAKGMFRYVTGKAAVREPANMKVSTPVATIGIRGTDFELFQSASEAGYVRVHAGEVIVVYRRRPRPVPPGYPAEASSPSGYDIVRAAETFHWDGSDAWRE
jgi:hypothetical protein